MNRFNRAILWVSFLSLLTCGSAKAQIFRRNQPTPAAVYTPVPPPPCVSASSPSVSLSPCDSSGSGCSTTCKDCKPVFRHKNHPDCDCPEICKPFLDPIIGTIEVISEKTAFYKDVVAAEKNIDVPVVVEKEENFIKFDKVTIDLKCCEIDICVPCEVCVKKTRKCEMRSKKVKLEARVRTSDGTVDVYALGVPGFPQEWVLRLCMSKSKVKEEFGIDIP